MSTFQAFRSDISLDALRGWNDYEERKSRSKDFIKKIVRTWYLIEDARIPLLVTGFGWLDMPFLHVCIRGHWTKERSDEGRPARHGRTYRKSWWSITIRSECSWPRNGLACPCSLEPHLCTIQETRRFHRYQRSCIAILTNVSVLREAPCYFSALKRRKHWKIKERCTLHRERDPMSWNACEKDCRTVPAMQTKYHCLDAMLCKMNNGRRRKH